MSLRDIDLAIVGTTAVHITPVAKVEPVGVDQPSIGVTTVDADDLGRLTAIVINTGGGEAWVALLDPDLAEQTAAKMLYAAELSRARGQA